MEDFKGLSGLKINLLKCKAVWIGKNRFDNTILCEDLKLIWTNEFRLLGIDFDSDLAKMDTNFRLKLEEIKKLYKSWLYRHLTPFGKITIIKSMALSKLSHIVLVCPHIAPGVLKELEQLSFHFLWNHKPDRIKRCDATLPYDRGGLNMPNIGQFWDSLKLSWSRRLITSDGVWRKILQLNLLANNNNMTDIWFGGPSLVENISQKMTNGFWKETLQIFARIMKEMPYSHPYYFYNLNIFNNELFAVNNRELDKNDFPALWDKRIVQVGEFFDMTMTPPILLSQYALNYKFNLNIDFLSYHRIKTSINQGNKNLNFKTHHPDLSDTGSPRLPPLHKLSSLQTKGCGIFYQTLRAREVSQNNTAKYESKWHNELGTIFSVQFWDTIWKFHKNQFISNRMKWVQLQINKFILPTNYSVNKYQPTQDPSCSFCPAGNHLERLSNLFWECPLVQDFWKYVENILQIFIPTFKLGRKEEIFGDVETMANSVENTVLLLGREFIWVQKFTSKKLENNNFKNFMKKELTQLFAIIQTKENTNEILKCWLPILDFLEVDHVSPSKFIDIMS